MKFYSRLPRENGKADETSAAQPEENETKTGQKLPNIPEERYDPAALLCALLLEHAPGQTEKMLESLQPYFPELTQQELRGAMECSREFRACSGQPRQKQQLTRLKVVSRCLKSGKSAAMLRTFERGIQLKSVLERTKNGDSSAALLELLPAMGNASQLFQNFGAANGAMDPAMLMQLLNRMGKRV